MNCYHYLLIAISVILVLEVFYDNLSEKIECLPKRKKFKFLPEKGGQRLFLYFIYLFPLIITAFSPVKDNFNIFHSIKEYMSFYATALTITFTVYSFLETQKATEKDRKEREDQQNKERREKENKDFELREKELEANRDYYRPIFVIENNELDNTKQVRLLMKDDNLYLEKIRFHDIKNKISPAIYAKSQNIIKSNIESTSFYITAETLKGETILFGYLNGLKIYKYLKFNQNPEYPNLKSINDDYSQEKVDEVWGTYNKTIDQHDNSLDHLLFFSTNFERNRNSLDLGSNSLKKVILTNTYTDFFKISFVAITDYIMNETSKNKLPNKNRISMVLHTLFLELKNCKLVINPNIPLIPLKNYNGLPSTISHEITNYNKKCNFDFVEFLNILEECTVLVKLNKINADYIDDIVTKLELAFHHIEVKKDNETNLIQLKREFLKLFKDEIKQDKNENNE